ncbi:hypothetical protein DITRI_Ditri06bG0119500 [Diplodiscus trichospermus]
MNNSAEIIATNLDLCAEILVRLPTKSLLKFKCVSKQWLSLISNSQFCLSHTRQHQHNGFLEPTALLLRVEFTVSPEFDVVPLKHYSDVPFFDYVNVPNIILRQSCNGLLICESLDDVGGCDVSRFFLCNPTTKKFKMLSFPRNPVKDCEFFINLAFDPLKSPDYKIISIREVAEGSYVFEMDIYSSSTDSWTVSRFTFSVDEESCKFEDVVFCKGVMYWNSYGNESLCFDVEDESFAKIPMPTPRNNALEIHRYFGESRGTLYLAVRYHSFISLELDVHEMASDYSHWFLKRRLNLGDAVKVFPELKLGCVGFSPGFSGVCFIQSEKEEKGKVVVWADGKIICYDFNDVAWKMLYDPGPGVKIGSDSHPFEHLHEARFLAYKYFENLSCI